MTFRPLSGAFVRRSWHSVLTVLDTTGRRRVKKAVVCVAQLVAALITTRTRLTDGVFLNLFTYLLTYNTKSPSLLHAKERHRKKRGGHVHPRPPPHQCAPTLLRGDTPPGDTSLYYPPKMIGSGVGLSASLQKFPLVGRLGSGVGLRVTTGVFKFSLGGNLRGGNISRGVMAWVHNSFIIY